MLMFIVEKAHNNSINADIKKRRSSVAPLFAAGYGERSVSYPIMEECNG